MKGVWVFRISDFVELAFMCLVLLVGGTMLLVHLMDQNNRRRKP